VRFKNKVAAVTGGGSGIGKEVAKRLVAEGGKAMINGDNKHAALLIAQEYEMASRQKKTLRQIQKTLESMRELVSGEVTPRATLRQVCEGWLATKRPETSPGTHEFYSRSVKKLLSGACTLRSESKPILW
jgi:NAD(P)-dependent dehydrogenase (short-subunit alcohol dehydrogenase family)